MNLYRHVRDRVVAIVDDLVRDGTLPAGLDTSRISVEPPKEKGRGEVTTNAAMVLAKAARMKPQDLARRLTEKLQGVDSIVAAEVAGPGFVNLSFDAAFWRTRLKEVLAAGPAYGDSKLGADRPVNVEYVSANPTGPMHVGHGRGAVFGDALAALLEKAGFAVTREYYINDAGAQVDVLARSLHLRYREALGETVGAIPEGLYPGEYLVDAGKSLAALDGKGWLTVPEAEWLEPLRRFAVDQMLALIRDDLKALGVTFRVFSSERALVEAGKVPAVVKFLEERDLVYTGTLGPPKGMLPDDWEPRPQLLFRATRFGDDVDRPLQKSDGSWTYFANDIAYHFDKIERGFASMIDVWGADHGGYVKRMQAAVKAMSDGGAELDVKLCQLVNLFEAGQPVKMSKRAGTFVTLRDVIDKVGKDVVRFIMLTRKNDAPLEFDFAKVMEQSRDNPVFYVQYAHARACSVRRNAAEAFGPESVTSNRLADSNLDRLTQPDELGLIRTMAAWPRLVESAAEAHEPHRLAFYLYDLAAEFHSLWNKGNDDPSLRFLVTADREVSLARLALLEGLTTIIASGLRVFGVAPVEEMR